MREVALQLIRVLIFERRNLAVLFRAQALENRIARVDDEHVAAGVRDRADEVAHKAIFLDCIDADPVLDRHRHGDRIAHRLHAVRHELRLVHQARAERTALHALGWTAAVQIDLVVAPLLTELSRTREVIRFTAAELQSDWRFIGRKREMARHIAVQQCAGGDHFCVKPRMA